MRREAAFAAHAATIVLAAPSMAALHTGEFEFCMVASVQRPTQSGGGTEGEKPVGRAERDSASDRTHQKSMPAERNPKK